MPIQLSWTMLGEPTAPTRDTSDPLGFRAAGTRIARTLVPGFTQRTSSVRGFGLVCLGLKVASDATYAHRDADETFRRFERFLVASQALHHTDATPLAGKRAALRYLDLARYPLNRPILAQQLSSGLWGTYRVAAAHYGLVRSRSPRFSNPQYSRLESDGAALARLVREASFDGVQIGTWVQKDTVSRSELARVAPYADAATDAEVAQFTAAVRALDAQGGHPIGRLRDRWEHAGGHLTPADLLGAGGKPMDDEQAAAARAAVALDRLATDVEAPFRQWVTGHDVQPPPADVWEADDWDDVIPYSHDLRRLRDAGRTDATFDTLLQHHRWLSGTRGARVWERSTPDDPRSAYHPYDFALGALSRLFAEGVMS
jgi:hypothetical protein